MSEDKKKFDDGGPCFGTINNAYDGGSYTSDPGKTLLDEFAGLAMSGLVVRGHVHSDPDDVRLFLTRLARSSYDIAEAMVAEKRRRERGE